MLFLEKRLQRYKIIMNYSVYLVIFLVFFQKNKPPNIQRLVFKISQKQLLCFCCANRRFAELFKFLFEF
jgi:hypothetical protein